MPPDRVGKYFPGAGPADDVSSFKMAAGAGIPRGGGMATFGQILKGLRGKAGMTQQELADLAQTTQRAVSFWEADRRDPSLTNLQRLCAALGVTCDVFFASERTTALRPPGRPRGSGQGRAVLGVAAGGGPVPADPPGAAARANGRAGGPCTTPE
jgi:DNA-binding XRE family transcriptional regulator